MTTITAKTTTTNELKGMFEPRREGNKWRLQGTEGGES
jgi:hypothetical protein